MHTPLLSLQMRVTIKSVFPDRDVAVMVRPALSEADLQRLDALPENKLRPEFKRVGADGSSTEAHQAYLDVWNLLRSIHVFQSSSWVAGLVAGC
jgi:hypothetical protein